MSSDQCKSINTSHLLTQPHPLPLVASAGRGVEEVETFRNRERDSMQIKATGRNFYLPRVWKKKFSHPTKKATGRDALYSCWTCTCVEQPTEAAGSQLVTMKDKADTEDSQKERRKKLGFWLHHGKARLTEPYLKSIPTSGLLSKPINSTF